MKIYLKHPTKSELHYRKEWLADPETMAYNKGYELDLKGYNKKTGTIFRTDEEMALWYENWTDNSEKYYAYIFVENIDCPIGEIYYYLDNDIYKMGILIQSKYRGLGFFKQSMNALFAEAKKHNIKELYDEFEEERVSTYQAFLAVGFEKVEDSFITKDNKQVKVVKVKKVLN